MRIKALLFGSLISAPLFCTLPVQADDTVHGKRVDNARVDIHDVPPDSEVQQPSGGLSGVRSTGMSGASTACTSAAGPASDAPFRVSIDGAPTAADGDLPREADRRRCTDVALERADVQVRYDSLAAEPEANVWAWPNAVVRGEKVEFRAWADYLPWISKAELRLFRPGQKPQEHPLAVLPLDWSHPVTWTAAGQDDTVYFLLRVYDAAGRFDETALKPLTLLDHALPRPDDVDTDARERLTGYGENSLTLRNIPVSGGTVTVDGRNLKPGQHVRAFGLDVPVDDHGRFAMRQIMAVGEHTVDVTVSDDSGSATDFRRNVTVASRDWFYVAMGDFTLGRNSTHGPAAEVTADATHYNGSTYKDGRAAFYVKGKPADDWVLTASADSGEQPLKDLFSNFSDKNPYYLLRNLDPDYYYPVYGDDSTTVDDAPTQGKFYVRLDHGDSRVMWGDFQTAWSGTELLQYSRGLYGLGGRYRSDETTKYGEKITRVDAFAAEPGTLAARDEFRGTGGSLYYLHHQDITQGSERLWVEVRDRDSGLVIDRKLMTAVQDYDVDYLQGRIELREPLESTGGTASLFMTASQSGDPVYLVATYEYVPGLAAVNGFDTGLRADRWFGDHLQLGLTGYHQGEAGNAQTLGGLDATLRYTPGTWLKIEGAQSNGAGSGSTASLDGGFAFDTLSTPANSRARAERVSGAVDFADLSENAQGRITGYAQNRERGFSGLGQIYANAEAAREQGLQAAVPLNRDTAVEAKVDHQDTDSMTAHNEEITLRRRVADAWYAAFGVRHDERDNTIPNASPTLSQNGGRTDAQLRLDYAPYAAQDVPPAMLGADSAAPAVHDWNAYGFLQGTLARDGTRDANSRVGAGGGWWATERIKLLGEVSDGDLGMGGKLGAKYRLSDRSDAYLNYVVETESPDDAWRGRQGTWVTGSTTRLSDNLRVFGETRSTHGGGPDSLSRAFGLDYAPNDRWSLGGKTEFGTLSDELSGDLDRKALSVSAAYRQGPMKYASNVEWRDETSTLTGDRTTWLLRNTLGYQATPAWRLMGKLNWSQSTNTQGAFYDGDYHEYEAAAAYRPISNDRWNTLFKYTDFYNLPSPGQLSAAGTVADYAQKTRILSVDTIYDLTPWLAVGGKYAFRTGELQPTRSIDQWFDSHAQLWVLRADVHFVKEWDALVELRRLNVREAEDARAGALVGIYRHIREGVKIGVGYNFTTYSDDLTDQSYRSRGWFVNLLGEI